MFKQDVTSFFDTCDHGLNDHKFFNGSFLVNNYILVILSILMILSGIIINIRGKKR